MTNDATTLAQDTAPEFLNERQVADLLCQSVRTLQKWRATGNGPAFYKFGQSVRYSRQELFDWAQTRRKAHTSSA